MLQVARAESMATVAPQPVPRALWTGFARSAERFPERPAVIVEGRTLSYAELRDMAGRIAATLQAHPEFRQIPLTAIFAYRSPAAFAGVLGALLAGNGYVPLNRTFPVERTEVMFERSECRSIIVDAGCLPHCGTLLQRSEHPLLVILPDLPDASELRDRWPNHLFFAASDLALPAAWREPTPNTDAIAYLLFTSGSTGTPKAVMVSHRNLAAFFEYMVDRYGITEHDRVSQMFDMTFDLSVFDMFMAWERGACLCCPPQKTVINPGKFIRGMGLTVWYCVPSTIAFMKHLGVLKPRRFESVRLSFFCGEPLPVSTASAWLEAAPNTIIENLYGPTETTLTCTYYRWDPQRSPAESEMDIVPIGYPHPGMNMMVVDPNLNEVEPGEIGELLINGPQVSLGYWRDPEKTAAAFLAPPGKAEVFYRTGDRVRRPVGDGPLTYLGRTDFQIKVVGHRVELGEVEAVVRKMSGLDGAIAIGWPLTSTGATGIEMFLEGEVPDKEQLRTAVAALLPDYMVPRRFHCMAQLPRNVNNKFDRKAMMKLLEEGI
jgi:amino acid adenylation domain-containing protein